MTFVSRPFIALVALALAAGCTEGGGQGAGTDTATSAGGAPAPVAAPAKDAGDRVATIGDRVVTRGELEESLRSELIKVETERYDVLKNGLDQIVATELLQQEAKARGTTPEALYQEEVVAKAGTPGDTEVEMLYQQAQAQLGGRSLEEVRPQLLEYLGQQRQALRREEFLGELKEKHKTTIALRPPVIQVDTAGGPEKGGGAAAPVTIIAFSDYECPYCQRAEVVVDQVMETYGDKIRLVFRDYPLPFHANAFPAAEAANCAGAQGKFWEYHNTLFKNQTALQTDDLKRYAGEVGLDAAQFETCLTEHTYRADVQKDLDEGGKVGVDGTPAFFINGRLLSGAQPFEAFKEVIDEELEAAS